MTVIAQLFAIFAFGLVICGVIFLGVIRAREVAERVARSEAARNRETPVLKRHRLQSPEPGDSRA